MADKTILILDDEPAMLVLLEKSLAGPGRRVVTADSGPQALQLVTRERPDLILLDVLMPEMDGLDVCRTLRASPATSDLPIIVLSAKASRDDIEAGLQAGADLYLVKPFEPNRLLETVNQVLAGGRTN
ncbi:MAG TPA: response regulator [Chloroflexota bacterium]|nr:response regulator [Chloroflexota bacterium]